MKIFHLSVMAFLLLNITCSSPQGEQEKSLPIKVAKAYGLEHFDKVKSLHYTWNVRMDSATVRSRSWKWDPYSGEVNYSGPDTTLTYIQSEKDSALNNIDSRFINDKYWLIFPFQLAWDSGYDHQISLDQPAPISGQKTTKLTIVYNNEDGYTPGDAYDIYLDKENKIIEWVFRRGNGATGRAMTWENVQDFDGIQIALDHRDDKGNKVLWFSDVSVQ